jgi:hypothetical protein
MHITVINPEFFDLPILFPGAIPSQLTGVAGASPVAAHGGRLEPDTKKLGSICLEIEVGLLSLDDVRNTNEIRNIYKTIDYEHETELSVFPIRTSDSMRHMSSHDLNA